MLAIKSLTKKYFQKYRQEQIGNGIINPLGFLPFMSFEKRMKIYNGLTISALMLVGFTILILLLKSLEG